MFHNFIILSSSSKNTSCAISSMLRSTLNSGSSISAGDSVLHFSFLTLGSSELSFGLLCSSLCTSFLVPEDALSDVSCCCCCCDCQALLSTIFGAGRGVESLSNKVLSFFVKSLCRCNLPARSCTQSRHETLSARIVVLCLVLGLN